MAKNRYVNTKFWDDDYISRLSPVEKLLFLYLLTNPLTNISGVYEISFRRMEFDTGIDRDKIEEIIAKFENNNKVKYVSGFIAIKNWRKHQERNSKIDIGIKRCLQDAPKELVEWLDIIIEQKPIEEKLYKKEVKKHIKKEVMINPEIEEIYNLYPSKCPVSYRSTGKNKRNIEQIKKAIDSLSISYVRDSITLYIQDCTKSNTYIKNFSTFLNNIPDPEELKKSNNIISNEDRAKQITENLLRKRNIINTELAL